MKRLLWLVVLAALVIPSPAAASWSRTWAVDTTFTAGAPADTITFWPFDRGARWVAGAWTVKLTAADDTSTVRVDWHQLGGDTSGYNKLTVQAGDAPGISGRLDSLKVYLAANHQDMRFRLVCVAGSNVPPVLGSDMISAQADVTPFTSGRSLDTTLTGAGHFHRPFYDRNWTHIRAEIVDVWADGSGYSDTVTVFGTNCYFVKILDAPSSYRWERVSVDSVWHGTTGAGRVGHSGQGVPK